MKKQISKIVAALAVGTLLFTGCKKPAASFTSDKTAVKVGEAVNFTNTSEGDAKAMWDFGDGSQLESNQNMVSHTYAKAGTYNVTLTAAKKNGKKPSDAPAIQITVSDKGTSAMFTSKSTVQAGEIVTFNSTSVDADEYTWDFGDGIQTNLTQPVSPVQTHIYTSNGTYMVTLTAFSQNRTVRSTYTSSITVVGGTGDNQTMAMLAGSWKITSHVFNHTYNGAQVGSCPSVGPLSYNTTASTFTGTAKIDVRPSTTGSGVINTYDGNGNIKSNGSYTIKDATHLTTWAHPTLQYDGSGTLILNSGVSAYMAANVIWTITTLNATTLEVTYTYRDNVKVGIYGTGCTGGAAGTSSTPGVEVATETVTYTKL
jgi:PKD repeat protein